jgi:hypothetical protein
MKRIFVLLFCGIFWGIFFPTMALSQHEHMHGEKMGEAAKKVTPKKTAVQSATVEGLMVTFEVMSMEEHMEMASMPSGSEHSKSHMIMVTLQDTASKEIVSDAKVGYAVIRPSGEKDTGKLVWSGDYYGGSFSPKEKGAYQVQLMIESGGMEREAKFTYSAK